MNIGAYCYTVARLVYLETLKGPDSRRVAIETFGHHRRPEPSGRGGDS